MCSVSDAMIDSPAMKTAKKKNPEKLDCCLPYTAYLLFEIKGAQNLPMLPQTASSCAIFACNSKGSNKFIKVI